MHYYNVNVQIMIRKLEYIFLMVGFYRHRNFLIILEKIKVTVISFQGKVLSNLFIVN